jgi:hypothetical protein
MPEAVRLLKLTFRSKRFVAPDSVKFPFRVPGPKFPLASIFTQSPLVRVPVVVPKFECADALIAVADQFTCTEANLLHAFLATVAPITAEHFLVEHALGDKDIEDDDEAHLALAWRVTAENGIIRRCAEAAAERAKCDHVWTIASTERIRGNLRPHVTVTDEDHWRQAAGRLRNDGHEVRSLWDAKGEWRSLA